jgi:L-asparaginase
MSSRRICVIYTGGTIGMGRTAHGFAPLPALGDKLRQALVQVPAFDVVEYAHLIDSSNATPVDWQMIARDIALRRAEYDGFVVLHGTDTMAYSASALSFMLRGITVPVVLTGSQIPFGEPNSDALANVRDALRFAATPTLAGVGLAFAGQLYRGCRARKVDSRAMAAFNSPELAPLAHIDAAGDVVVSAGEEGLPGKESFELADYEAGRVLSFRFAPGMPLAALEALLALKPRALLLEAYGLGNAPDAIAGLAALLAQATSAGVVIAVLTQTGRGGVSLGDYAAGSWLLRAGTIPAGDMTFEAAFTKLHHLFAQGLSPDAVKAAFVTPLAGEMAGEGGGEG